MHVTFGVVRNVIVQHVADALHIQATRGHVGGDQDVQLAVLELLDGAFTLLLLHVAVDGGGGQATGLQFLRQFFGAQLGAGEDDHGFEGFCFQDPGQRIQFVHATDEPVALADVGGRGGLGGDGDFLRVTQVGLGDAADHRRHGGREQGDLAGRRSLLQHRFHVIDEAHAQHFVGFVQHQRGQLGQVQGAAVQMVDDATRRSHHHVHATLQSGQLRRIALATVDRQHHETGDLVGIALEGLGDLDGQFAGWCQHERLRLFLVELQARQDRQGEGRGLAGAGLGLAQHVLALQQGRDGGRLDGRRRLVADLGDRGHDRR